MLKRQLMLAFWLLILAAGAALAAVPSLINFQGQLNTSAGNPVADGNYSVAFNLYDAPSGGNVVWTEVQSVAVAKGTFNVLLGSITPLTDTIFNSPNRYLGIKVGADPELVPRKRLISSPYSLRTSTIDGASGGVITGNLTTGSGNSNTGTNSFVAGSNNIASAPNSSIAGGANNRARGQFSFVGGGGGAVSADSNAASGGASAVVGGQFNRAKGGLSIVGGGGGNQTSGYESAICGGNSNVAAGATSFIGGGDQNLVDTVATTGSAIVGGELNQIANGSFSFIGGGAGNNVSNSSGAVAGGEVNTVSGWRSFVGAGHLNKARGDYSTIAGGGSSYAGASDSNLASGASSTIGGGGSQIAGGDYSTIPGGFDNTANGKYSFAAGRRARALNDGCFVWADTTNSDFASTAPHQFLIRASGGVGIGTNAPEAPLHVFESSAGTVTANAASIAVFERAGSNYLSLITPTANERGILFGDPSNSSNGVIMYNNAALKEGFQFRAHGNVTRMSLDSLGDLSLTGSVCATNIACPSDERLKENIHPLSNAIERIDQLKGVEYNWRKDIHTDLTLSDDKQVGVLAQDVEKVLPQAVVKMSDGYLAVDYNRLVPLLIQGMKEQQKEIAEQQKQINEMKEMVKGISHSTK